MSVEHYPNLHASGLVVDLYNAINDRIRGDALPHRDMILASPRISKMVQDFVNELDESIDDLVRIMK